jgi:sulfur carrier protein ThiS
MPQHVRRLRILLPALVLLALALPSVASAQATRTWVSGVGDDANPCSRTAPCKTFAGAISKTAAGGIIDAMDDGGFGAVTITKAVTIDGGHHTAGLLASGGINAVNIAAGVNDKVVLKNLDIEGNGTTLGLNGVRITQAKSVRITDSQISNFSRSGISLEPNAGVTTKLVASRNHIYDNGGNGVNVAPLNGATGNAMLKDNDLENNGCGMALGTFGMTNVFTTNCGTAAPAANVGVARINAFDNEVSANNSLGVLSRGGTVRMSGNTITLNTTGGIQALDSGTVLSYGTNVISGNFGPDGAPSSPVIPLAKRGH